MRSVSARERESSATHATTYCCIRLARHSAHTGGDTTFLLSFLNTWYSMLGPPQYAACSCSHSLALMISNGDVAHWSDGSNRQLPCSHSRLLLSIGGGGSSMRGSSRNSRHVLSHSVETREYGPVSSSLRLAGRVTSVPKRCWRGEREREMCVRA